MALFFFVFATGWVSSAVWGRLFLWITEFMLAQKVCCRAATWVKSLCFAGNS